MTIYEKLSIKPVINAGGTLTMLGGSLMDPSVLETMKEASTCFIDIDKLHKHAGERVASLLGVEAACITSGAAAGMAISAAACVAGTNKACILQLPDTTGMKSEALVLKSHRNLYDQALLQSGVRFKEVGTTSFACTEMIENAVSGNIAFFFYASEAEPMRGSLDLNDIMPIMKKHNIPVIVDAAAELPPRENITKYLEIGADLVVFSGGKEIRGPQSSGVIVGRKELIEACDANCCPHHSIGRPMKIDKETIAGFVRAVELFAERDFDKDMERWNSITDHILDQLKDKPGITIRKGYPVEPGIQPANIPRAYIQWDSIPSEEIKSRLFDSETSVFVGIESDYIAVNPQCLKDDEISVLITQLKAL